MANGIRTGDPHGFNKGSSSKFCVGSRVGHIPEEDWRTYRPKRCRSNNKDEDNSPKTFNDKNPIFLTSYIFHHVCISLEKSFSCLNTKFNKRKGKLWT